TAGEPPVRAPPRSASRPAGGCRRSDRSRLRVRCSPIRDYPAQLDNDLPQYHLDVLIRPFVRPPALNAGDCVMLVAPSGPTRRGRIDIGIEMVTPWGLQPVLAAGALDRHGYLAGPDEVRLAGLNAALRDPAVRGIICTRGGYGAQRIVDGLDYAATV